MIDRFLSPMPAILAVVVLASILFEVGLYLSAVVEMRANSSRNQHQLWRRVLASPLVPRISVLMPAYNEEVWIASSVARTLALRYPDIEVVVINDGSSDATMAKLEEAFELSPVLPTYRKQLETAHVRSIQRSKIEPNLVVVNKDNGGKADALNVGLNIATGELVCAIDADTIVSSDALLQLVAPFLSRSDTVAVGGTIRLINGSVPADERLEHTAPRGLLLGAQTVEYVRSFLVGRLGWNALGGSLVISGAFGVFDRQRMIDIDGYNPNSIGEDMELVVRLRRKGYEEGRFDRVSFVPNPVAWTEAPSTWRTLGRQRNRWFRGLLDVLVRHRDMVFNPKYGTAGMIAVPYFFVVEALAPFLEGLGMVLVALGLITGSFTSGQWGLLALAYAFGIARTAGILVLSDLAYRTQAGFGSRLRMIGFILFEIVVVRPATIVWRMWGLWLFLRGDRTWGAQERRGLAPS
jgi:cellulose synthase/poly-beta-1,6-N-acetylglucosamine synthase-like glycosyltransferase